MGHRGHTGESRLGMSESQQIWRKPHALTTPSRPLVYLLSYVEHPQSQRGSAPAVSSLGTVSCKLSSSSRKSCHSQSRGPFLLPSCPQQIHAVFLSLLITFARRKADGPAFIDTITARSSSLHCLEACLYLSLNPFCHFLT